MTMRFDVESMAGSVFDNVAIKTESLPFLVKVATTDAQLERAVGLRQAAYARHVPDFAAQLIRPEAEDYATGSIVLFAESKLDGSVLGTMRIQTNLYGPLKIEESIELPEWLHGVTLAEATRLGVTEGREGRMVKTVLFKAFFQYCQDAGIDWLVITARKPVDRQYESLLFVDVFSQGEYIPMHHVGGIPHRVMAFNMCSAEERWIAAKHPLYDFMCRTRHPDIHLPELSSQSALSHYLPPAVFAAGNRMPVVL